MESLYFLGHCIIFLPEPWGNKMDDETMEGPIPRVQILIDHNDNYIIYHTYCHLLIE